MYNFNKIQNKCNSKDGVTLVLYFVKILGGSKNYNFKWTFCRWMTADLCYSHVKLFLHWVGIGDYSMHVKR
jgi:hypothetical protein